MDLVEIAPDGRVAVAGLDFPTAAPEAFAATVRMYAATGFHRPWIGYVALEAGQAVGFCAFKSPPVAGRVEIAYNTFPACEGRGVATRMAGQLVEITGQTDRALTVIAQTLPAEGASTAILRKLGFRLLGTVQHPEDGPVWEWTRPP